MTSFAHNHKIRYVTLSHFPFRLPSRVWLFDAMLIFPVVMMILFLTICMFLNVFVLSVTLAGLSIFFLYSVHDCGTLCLDYCVTLATTLIAWNIL